MKWITEIINPTAAPDLAKAIRAYNRAAVKAGVPAASVYFGEPVAVDVRQAVVGIEGVTYKKICTVEALPVLVEYAPLLVDGWHLVAVVEREVGDFNVVRRAPGADEVLPETALTDMRCDYCGHKRNRTAAHWYARGAELKLVGRECSRKFFGGVDAGKLVDLLALVTSYGLPSDGDEETFGGGGWRVLYAVEQILAVAVAIAETEGFVSSKAATDDRPSTAALVSRALTSRRKEDQVTPTQSHVEQAAKIVQWVLATFPSESRNEYQSNVLVCLMAGSVGYNRIGLVTSLVGSFAREATARAARDTRPSEHVGEVGKRQIFRVEFVGQSSFDTDYGTMFVQRWRDLSGNVLVWKTSNPAGADVLVAPATATTPARFEWLAAQADGTVWVGKATVKKHDEYKGTKQTVISRVEFRPA